MSSGRLATVGMIKNAAKKARPCIQRRLALRCVQRLRRAAARDASSHHKTAKPQKVPAISRTRRILLSVLAWASLSGGSEYACSDLGCAVVACACGCGDAGAAC